MDLAEDVISDIMVLSGSIGWPQTTSQDANRVLIRQKLVGRRKVGSLNSNG